MEEEPTKRPGLWARLFGRRPNSEPEPEPDTPLTAAVDAEPEAAEPEPEPEPEPSREPDPARIAADKAMAVLDDTLDALGAAHHRPFSRG